jgi:hypothetical protein
MDRSRRDQGELEPSGVCKLLLSLHSRLPIVCSRVQGWAKCAPAHSQGVHMYHLVLSTPCIPVWSLGLIGICCSTMQGQLGSPGHNGSSMQGGTPNMSSCQGPSFDDALSLKPQEDFLPRHRMTTKFASHLWSEPRASTRRCALLDSISGLLDRMEFDLTRY